MDWYRESVIELNIIYAHNHFVVAVRKFYDAKDWLCDPSHWSQICLRICEIIKWKPLIIWSLIEVATQSCRSKRSTCSLFKENEILDFYFFDCCASIKKTVFSAVFIWFTFETQFIRHIDVLSLNFWMLSGFTVDLFILLSYARCICTYYLGLVSHHIKLMDAFNILAATRSSIV